MIFTHPDSHLNVFQLNDHHAAGTTPDAQRTAQHVEEEFPAAGQTQCQRGQKNAAAGSLIRLTNDVAGLLDDNNVWRAHVDQLISSIFKLLQLQVRRHLNIQRI